MAQARTPRAKAVPDAQASSARTYTVSVKPPLPRRCRGGHCFTQVPTVLELSPDAFALLQSDPYLIIQETVA